MLKIGALMLAIIISIFIVTSIRRDDDNTQKPAPEPATRTYNNPGLGVSFTYPGKWGEVEVKSIPRVRYESVSFPKSLESTKDFTYFSFSKEANAYGFFSDAATVTDTQTVGVTDLPNTQVYYPTRVTAYKDEKTYCVSTTHDNMCPRQAYVRDGVEKARKITTPEGGLGIQSFSTIKPDRERTGAVAFFEAIFPRRKIDQELAHSEFFMVYKDGRLPNNILFVAYDHPDKAFVDKTIQEIANSVHVDQTVVDSQLKAL